MRVLAGALGIALLLTGISLAQDIVREAERLEAAGHAAEAARILRSAAGRRDASLSVLRAWAEFLDARGDPDLRAAYERLMAAAAASNARELELAAARRLVVASLEAGDNQAAARYLERYRKAGGSAWPGAAIELKPVMPAVRWQVTIPGPLNSFRRMAAISEDVPAEAILAALARNVIMSGYHAGTGKEGLVQTEYLKLLIRYISQARELEKLAGPDGFIRIEACESVQTGDILRILGYRMRGGCGAEVVLETVNATRAFLTIDSGFPLAELEQALRTNRPFVYNFQPTRVPSQWDPAYLMGARQAQKADFLDVFLSDPSLCRLYLGLSKPDPETAEELRKNIPLERLKAFAHVLDFFGSMFEIRQGQAVVPGGDRSARVWEDLVGAPPKQGARFFDRLISRDDGWLASYFDALARMNGPVKDYLTDPARLRRFYQAIRGRVTSPGPARPVFQSNTDMLLLTTRLRLEPDGKPHIPGGLEVWRRLFIDQGAGKTDERLMRQARDWKDPDDLLEALFALSRRNIENQPLKIFLTLTDLNRNRRQPLEAATVDRLARSYAEFGAQYPLFTEVPTLTDGTILSFLDTAERLNEIGSPELRADAIGSMQAVVGLWQILCRLEAIPAEQADALLAGLIEPFGRTRNARDVFDAGRRGVEMLLKAAGTQYGAPAHERLLELLAGGESGRSSEFHTEAVAEMQAYFDAQRLVPVTLLFELADHAERVAKGEKPDLALINRVGSRLATIEAPRAALSTVERNGMQLGYWSERHIESQRRMNLRQLLERVARDPSRAQDVRAALAPVLRDSLVGLNYIYYAPPGAQLLRSSPSFVRSHDFIGIPGSRDSWRMPAPVAAGWPAAAGGRLSGSLVGLPYALAQAEQNFLIPTREQALIWGDLVPQLLQAATVPRWWRVTASQLHWVGLHIRYAASLLAESALDAELRNRVLEVLSRQAVPARVYRVARLLEAADAREAFNAITPAEAFVLAKEILGRETVSRNLLAERIRRTAASSPSELNYEAVSHAFGTPKPTLTSSYRPELLYLRTFPTLMGYSSRVLAESWESNALYWAALADEVYLPPAQLNQAVPEWTRLAIERIFASHLEDWPAVLESMRYVGEDIRRQWRKAAEAERQALLDGSGDPGER